MQYKRSAMQYKRSAMQYKRSAMQCLKRWFSKKLSSPMGNSWSRVWSSLRRRQGQSTVIDVTLRHSVVIGSFSIYITDAMYLIGGAEWQALQGSLQTLVDTHSSFLIHLKKMDSLPYSKCMADLRAKTSSFSEPIESTIKHLTLNYGRGNDRS